MVKLNKDIPVGAIVTSDNNKDYVVLVDDAGQRGLYTDKGTWFRFNGDGLTFGKNGSGTISRIKIFDTLPPLDAISEAVKYMYTGRAACAHMKVIYTAEDPAVTEAKARKTDLAHDIDRLMAKMNDLDDFIRRNSR